MPHVYIRVAPTATGDELDTLGETAGSRVHLLPVNRSRSLTQQRKPADSKFSEEITSGHGTRHFTALFLRRSYGATRRRPGKRSELIALGIGSLTCCLGGLAQGTAIRVK